MRTAVLALFAIPLLLTAQDRILTPLDQTRTIPLKGHIHPSAQPQNDVGPVDPSMELGSVTFLMKPSPAQQAALDKLLIDQQDPASGNFHRWISPEQFADRFGLSRADIAKTVAWLESKGLKVRGVARGRHWITFSGTAEQVGRAFLTDFHHYLVDGEMHFANVTNPSIPVALENVTGGIEGLSDFQMMSAHGRKDVPAEFLDPGYSNSAGFHYLSPDDIATIYNVAPLYQAGFDGSGQKIVVAGRTDINLADIQAFRRRFNLPPNDPQKVLVGPDPGIVAADLSEADIDIEWSGAVARNATIIYVYSTNVRNSAQYAVDQNLAPVITLSYGSCEPATTAAFRSVAQQANAQGITWLACTGDSGAGGCEKQGVLPQAAKGRAVWFPASIPEITAVGGTEFDDASGNYWATQNSANAASALSYIPEIAWNDSALLYGLASGGGGASTFFPKPAWQTGPGVPDDNARDVPDLALSASWDHDGYIVYTGGSSGAYGGTSVATPEFAGIIALLNQYLTSKGILAQPGLGNINPSLYRLAQTTTNIFHDITSGDNIVPCVQGTADCSTGSFGYSAGPGYDLTTGWGSVDAYNLVTQWTTGTTSTTELTASPASIAFANGTTQLTATVSSPGATPAGSVTFLAADASLGSAPLTASGATQTATLTVTSNQLTVGSNTITAVYGGSGTLNGSSGTATVTVTPPASGSAVVATVTPNPVYQQPPNAAGYTWFYTVRLTEQAGVATTLTGFSIGSTSYDSQILSFFPSTSIPAKGTLSASIESKGLKPPVNLVFAFRGMDASGQTWTQQITVPFIATVLVEHGMLLSSTPSNVLQNPAAADPSCQWSQQLVLQEQSGYLVELTKMSAGAQDLTPQIQQLFGTTRLAPFGRLQAVDCFTGITVPTTTTYQISGTTESGATVSTSLTSSLGAPASSPATPSVSPQSVTMTVADSSGSANSSLALSFAGGAPSWSVSVSPSNVTTNWLTVSPLSGTGPAQINIQAFAAGLANGVYSALLVVQAVNGIPQYINVPVTLVVGASSTTKINGLTNGASFKTLFAPGMLMSVFGEQLAPSPPQQAPSLPLPLSMGGVAVTINGETAPLYYVSPTQLNVQIPYETGAGPAILGVNNNGQVSSFLFTVSISSPGIFMTQDGKSNLVPFATAKRGDTLSAYITGDGDVTPTLQTGRAPSANTLVTNLPRPRLPVTLTIGGVPADISFIGIPTWAAGVTQINFTVPPNAPLGVQSVVVTVGTVPSASVNLTVTN